MKLSFIKILAYEERAGYGQKTDIQGSPDGCI